MTSIVKASIVVPAAIQRRAGIKAGDRLEFKVAGGMITILPKLPTAADEYTHELRRIIDARLAEAERGPFHGPFNSGDELAAYLKAYKRRRSRSTKAKKPR